MVLSYEGWEAPHPDGTGRFPWGGTKHRRQGMAIVRRSDAKRTGSVGAEKPHRSFEDRSCLGMVLTEVSAHGV
jgi:hypothetical protein